MNPFVSQSSLLPPADLQAVEGPLTERPREVLTAALLSLAVWTAIVVTVSFIA